jgi:hypothetical protein
VATDVNNNILKWKLCHADVAGATVVEMHHTHCVCVALPALPEDACTSKLHLSIQECSAHSHCTIAASTCHGMQQCHRNHSALQHRPAATSTLAQPHLAGGQAAACCFNSLASIINAMLLVLLLLLLILLQLLLVMCCAACLWRCCCAGLIRQQAQQVLTTLTISLTLTHRCCHVMLHCCCCCCGIVLWLVLCLLLHLGDG